MLKIKSSDFDSEIFECVDNALSTLGEHQREFVRLRFKNRHYLPLKDVARAPDTFERSLTESLGTSVSETVMGHILNNISRTFGIHVASNSTLSLAVETARKRTIEIVPFSDPNRVSVHFMFPSVCKTNSRYVI